MKFEQDTNKTFVSINECSKLTGLARGHIRKLCREGSVPCLRVGEGRNASYKIHLARFCDMLESRVSGNE